MCNTLELSVLFVSFGGLSKCFSAWGTEKIAGLWFARGNQYPGWHYALVLSHRRLGSFQASMMKLSVKIVKGSRQTLTERLWKFQLVDQNGSCWLLLVQKFCWNVFKVKNVKNKFDRSGDCLKKVRGLRSKLQIVAFSRVTSDEFSK